MASLRPLYHLRAASECSALMASKRSTRSRSARAAMLTRQAMPGFEICEELPRRPGPALSHILQALADTLARVGLRGNIQQSLISFGILHNGSGLALYGQYDGTLALLELFHELAGAASERRQRLDVFRDVEHKPASIKAPF